VSHGDLQPGSTYQRLWSDADVVRALLTHSHDEAMTDGYVSLEMDDLTMSVEAGSQTSIKALNTTQSR